MIKINVKALGLAVGITWMAGLVLLGILDALFGWGDVAVRGIGSIYLGYDATFAGILIGGIWAFIDGFIAGAIVAWLYNRFIK